MKVVKSYSHVTLFLLSISITLVDEQTTIATTEHSGSPGELQKI